jgi:hypothetical protein
LRAVLARSNDRSVIATVNKITTSNTIVTVGNTNPATGNLALRPIAISDRSIALIRRFAPERVTPRTRRSRDTITFDNLLLNIHAFLNYFRDGIAGSYCSTVQSHFYMVPILLNLHISLWHKFITKYVLWLKNKTDKPASNLTADICRSKSNPARISA